MNIMLFLPIDSVTGLNTSLWLSPAKPEKGPGWPRRPVGPKTAIGPGVNSVRGYCSTRLSGRFQFRWEIRIKIF